MTLEEKVLKLYEYGEQLLSGLPSERVILLVLIECTVLLCLVIMLFGYACKRLRRMRYLRSPLSKIDRMKGEEFERYLKAYFEEKGYRVRLTPESGDYGADLVMTRGLEKVVVQAKRYSSAVGIKAVQEIIGAKSYYHADHCIVATNRYFTANAKELAKKAGVELWDRKRLFGLKK